MPPSGATGWKNISRKSAAGTSDNDVLTYSMILLRCIGCLSAYVGDTDNVGKYTGGGHFRTGTIAFDDYGMFMIA